MGLGWRLLLLSALAVARAWAGDYLELKVEVHTRWESSRRTNEHYTSAVCVVGTNVGSDWYISGQFLKNARVEYWLVGTTVVERQEINSNMYFQRARDMIAESLGQKRRSPIVRRYPAKGQVSVKAQSWLEPFGYGVERAVWLAFCSGTFLQATNRQVPLPLGHFSDASGFVEKTQFHVEDTLSGSLPKSIIWFGVDQMLVCTYETIDTTNMFGRIVPTKFRVVQYEVSASRTRGGSKATLVGTIESIKLREEPVPPLRVDGSAESKD